MARALKLGLNTPRRHCAGYSFAPDCEYVRVNGGVAPRVL